MNVVRGNEAETFEVQGNVITKLIAPSTGATEIMAWRPRVRPGSWGVHSHAHEEVIIALSGTAKIRIQGEEYTLSGGDACVIPANIPHQLITPGPEPFECVVAFPVGTSFIDADGRDTTPPWAE